MIEPGTDCFGRAGCGWHRKMKTISIKLGLLNGAGVSKDNDSASQKLPYFLQSIKIFGWYVKKVSIFTLNLLAYVFSRKKSEVPA